MKKIIATIIVAAGITAAFAENSTNTAIALRRQSPGSAARAFDFTLTRGNSDTTLFTVKLLTDRKDNINELAFGADAAYGQNSGVESTESAHAFGQWNHLFSDKFFGYLRVEGLHDGIADIKYRAMVGPGAGYFC